MLLSGCDMLNRLVVAVRPNAVVARPWKLHVHAAALARSRFNCQNIFAVCLSGSALGEPRIREEERPKQQLDDASFTQPAAKATAVNRISHLGAISRAAVSAGAAVLALADPSRGDMVALLGELTAPPALRRMRDNMARSAEGRAILAERPRIRESSVDINALLAGPQNTFGAAYARYMRRHGFTPDERHEVSCVDGDTPDGELSYVLQRYREVHDMWHVLSGLPPSVLGEAAVKWLEMAVTGLPMTALAAFAAPVRMPPSQVRAYFSIYVPWASRVGASALPLMSVRYEDLMHRDLAEVRAALHFKPAPADGPAGFMG